MKRVLILLALLLAACNTPPETGGSSAFAENPLIQWDRSPETVVFRADIVGGSQSDTFMARNEIPPCTIYGDNRIVWTNDVDGTQIQVLWDILTDQQIQDFIAFMTISQAVFNYDAGADLLAPSETQPVVEVIEVNVNGRSHRTDSFSSTPWPQDYFESVVNFCSQVSRAPVLYEPTGAWLSVRSIEYDSTRPVQVWNSEASGLDLEAAATRTEPEWLTGPNLKILWNMLRGAAPNLMFINFDGDAFEVVLESPEVHPNSPPSP